jgi:hypothetical protein
LSTLFAFVFPSVSHLIYMFHTDNSRLSVLLFWLSVLGFQRWTRGSTSWSGLLVPISLYCLATLTYENTTFLIFAVPLFIWPVRVQCRNGLSDREFLMRLGAGVGMGFVAFLAIRFGVFSGGAVGHRALIPPLGLVEDYLANLAFYCLMPFRELSTDKAAWVWGIGTALLAACLLRGASSADDRVDRTHDGWEQSPAYIALLGLALPVLGTLPYLLAGYDPDPGFTSQSRVFSSASFGLPILMALAATAWTDKTVRAVTATAALVVLAFMAVFLAGLRGDWQAAAEDRDDLCADLLRQVPDVKPGTTFLFLDLQWYLSRGGVDRAVVFQGVDGLGEFIRMIYGKKDVYAYFLYPRDLPSVEDKGRTATASPEGFMARGSAVRPPIPLESLLIFKRVGTKLVLVDHISAQDAAASVNWKGISSIHSNRELIVPRQGSGDRLMPIRRQSRHMAERVLRKDSGVTPVRVVGTGGELCRNPN